MTPLLTVKELTKRYGASAMAVDHISFEIMQGRCVALLGPNGAGKTTTLSMLAGLLSPSHGSISFASGASRDIREWIGFLPQHPAFFNWMSGREFLEFTGRLARLSAGEARSRSAELLEIVGLADAAKRAVGGYSGGMKQRLGIAQALIHRPKLLMLDEPVSALDPIGRREVLELMRSMKNETTLLFSTHVLHDADEICDDVILMQKGQISVSGDLRSVRNQYRRPLIKVQGEQPLAPWIAEWDKQSFIESMQWKHAGSVDLLVRDQQMERARTFICKDIAERGIPIQGLEFGQSTLEDLFMQVVGGESKR